MRPNPTNDITPPRAEPERIQVQDIRCGGGRLVIELLLWPDGREQVEIRSAPSQPSRRYLPSRDRVRLPLSQFKTLEQAVKQLRGAVRRHEAKRRARKDASQGTRS